MNKKTIVVLASTYILGAVAGALTIDRVWTKRFERELDAESLRIKLDYARYYSGEDGKPPINNVVVNNIDAEVFKQEADKVIKSIADRVPKEPVDYTKMYQGGTESHPIMDLSVAQRLVEQTSAQSELIQAELNNEPEEEEGPEEVIKNVFDDNPLPPDFENRADGGVYILTTDEFMEEPKENGYTTVTCTWFEYDNTLIDETDGQESIISIEDTITEDALRHFGWNPNGDKDTIFVRNEKSKIDFEVTLDERSYAEAIAGFTEEDEKRPRRKRPEDD